MVLRLCFSDGILAGIEIATSSIPWSSGDRSPLDIPHTLTSLQRAEPASNHDRLSLDSVQHPLILDRS